MIIIIQNDPEVPPGTYGSYIDEAGLDHRVVPAWQGGALPEPQKGDAVIVLGGAMGIHETDLHPFLVPVKAYIRRVLDLDIPFLGICLGGQLLAEAAGGTVTPSSGLGEKGVHSITLTPHGRLDLLFHGLANPFVTFQWHSDSFDLPPEAVHLASSAVCPYQAFRIGNAYGLQFHPEVDEEIVRVWSSETPDAAADCAKFVESFCSAGNGYREPSLRLLRNFLAGAGVPANG